MSRGSNCLTCHCTGIRPVVGWQLALTIDGPEADLEQVAAGVVQASSRCAGGNHVPSKRQPLVPPGGVSTEQHESSVGVATHTATAPPVLRTEEDCKVPLLHEG